MTKPARMVVRPEWAANCSTFFEKLDPKIRKRFARRLRELERLKAEIGLVEPPVENSGHEVAESVSPSDEIV